MSHEVIDQRSLELHRAIVRRLQENPGLFDVARQNLHRWLSRNSDSKSLVCCYREWLQLLDERTPDQICELLVDESEEGRRLRQNSPFAGILKPREVWDIKRRFAGQHASR